MIIYLIYLRLKYIFLLFIIFISNLDLFITEMQIALWRLRLSYALTLLDINNFFKSESSPELELYTDVKDAMISTYYENPLKCVTAISHPAFNKEKLLIVEEYNDEATAKAGHENWIKIFKRGLPTELKDITNDKTYKREFIDYREDDDYEV